MNIAYVAGLIDGEGSIHIEETKGKWYAPRMTLGMTLPALEVMEDLHKEFGGTLRLFRKSTDKWAEAWMWHIHGEDCRVLLEKALPYLRIKKDHALIALRVASIRNSLPKRVNGNAKWTEEARMECRLLNAQVKELNRKGPPVTNAKSVEVV